MCFKIFSYASSGCSSINHSTKTCKRTRTLHLRAPGSGFLDFKPAPCPLWVRDTLAAIVPPPPRAGDELGRHDSPGGLCSSTADVCFKCPCFWVLSRCSSSRLWTLRIAIFYLQPSSPSAPAEGNNTEKDEREFLGEHWWQGEYLYTTNKAFTASCCLTHAQLLLRGYWCCVMMHDLWSIAAFVFSQA